MLRKFEFRPDPAKYRGILKSYQENHLIIEENQLGDFLERAAHSGEDLQGLCLENVKLSGLNLDGLKIYSGGIVHCDILQCSLKGADLSGMAIISSQIRSTDMSKSKLSGTHIIGGLLHDVNLTDAEIGVGEHKLGIVRFEGVQAKAVKYTGCTLDGKRLWELNPVVQCSPVGTADGELSINAFFYEDKSCPDVLVLGEHSSLNGGSFSSLQEFAFLRTYTTLGSSPITKPFEAHIKALWDYQLSL
jgi:hypothetical protein